MTATTNRIFARTSCWPLAGNDNRRPRPAFGLRNTLKADHRPRLRLPLCADPGDQTRRRDRPMTRHTHQVLARGPIQSP
jgi:hypothetical protein